MTTWAIGDVQGCWQTLSALLQRIDFKPGRDRVWLVGDLVNRGPASAAVLRWAREVGDPCVAVLGNHDLHLLAVAEGAREQRRGDTLDDVLDAPDRKQLLKWLRRRPLLHREDDDILVHAGVLPSWTARQAAEEARGIERILRGHGAAELLRTPNRATRVALEALTRLRMVDAKGRPDGSWKGTPRAAPAGLCPWFDHPHRRPRGVRFVFGHWAALGLVRRPDVLALDTGCVWGRALTAVSLEGGEVVQERSRERRPPPTG